jgi:hypothetical protein
MRQDFNNLIQKLKVDPYTSIVILDNDTLKHIIQSPMYGAEIVSKHGSIENYLEKIKRDGHINLSFQEFRKNGSSAKRVGLPISINFSEKEPVSTSQSSNPGLNGLAFYEQVNLHSDSRDKIRLEAENERLKIRTEAQETEIATLKEQILKDKYDATKSSKTTETITAFMPVVLEALKGFGGGGANQGLAMPQLSDVKTKLQQMLPVLPDPYITVLLNVVSKLNSDDEEFYPALLKLIETENVTQE